jgi:hypothetical protein
MEKIKSMVFRSRHTLLLTSVVAFIVLVVIEGIVMDRDSRIFTLDNEYFEFNATNIEEFEARLNRDR